MKKLIILLQFCLMFLFCACWPKYKPHRVVIEDDFIEVEFGRKMSRELLDSIAQAVGKKGISLSYPDLFYDGDVLSKIKIQVIDGREVGQATYNFVYKGKPFGFRINHRPGAQIPMVIGELQ